MPSLLVPIDFIRGDENRRAGVAQLTERLQHVGGSQSVDLVGFQRSKIGIPDQRLCREVEHKIRAASKDGFSDFPGIAKIAEFMPKPVLKFQLREKRGLRSQGEPRDSGAHFRQPDREPATFKPSVTAKPYALTTESASEDHQFFQGALPAAQSSSRY